MVWRLFGLSSTGNKKTPAALQALLDADAAGERSMQRSAGDGGLLFAPAARMLHSLHDEVLEEHERRVARLPKGNRGMYRLNGGLPAAATSPAEAAATPPPPALLAPTLSAPTPLKPSSLAVPAPAKAKALPPARPPARDANKSSDPPASVASSPSARAVASGGGGGAVFVSSAIGIGSVKNEMLEELARRDAGEPKGSRGKFRLSRREVGAPSSEFAALHARLQDGRSRRERSQSTESVPTATDAGEDGDWWSGVLGALFGPSLGGGQTAVGQPEAPGPSAAASATQPPPPPADETVSILQALEVFEATSPPAGRAPPGQQTEEGAAVAAEARRHRQQAALRYKESAKWRARSWETITPSARDQLEADWQESGLASGLADHEIRRRAAELEPAWRQCGQEAGVEV